MSHDLRRGILAAFAVGLIFLAFIVFDAAVVTIKLQRIAASREGLDLLDRGFPWLLLLIASGILPSIVLQRFKISRYAAYLVVGALSGWLSIYSFWFEFGETFGLFDYTPKPRVLGAVLIDAITGVTAPLAVNVNSWIFWTMPAGCLFGVFCAWLYWLLAVRLVFRRRETHTRE